MGSAYAGQTLYQLRYYPSPQLLGFLSFFFTWTESARNPG